MDSPSKHAKLFVHWHNFNFWNVILTFLLRNSSYTITEPKSAPKTLPHQFTFPGFYWLKESAHQNSSLRVIKTSPEIMKLHWKIYFPKIPQNFTQNNTFLYTQVLPPPGLELGPSPPQPNVFTTTPQLSGGRREKQQHYEFFVLANITCGWTLCYAMSLRVSRSSTVFVVLLL